MTSNKHLEKRLSRMICHYIYQDPPSKQGNFISLGLVMSITATVGTCPKAARTSNLITVTLFFCLRSCKYFKISSHYCTTQFYLQDIQFHNAKGIIPVDISNTIFLEASTVTFFLDM